EAGILTVAAAGNSGNDIRNYPAGYEDPGIVSVAATTRDDAMAFFSSFGAFVDIGAPGFEIISTVPENAYQLLSGTSMAAPHVAGVAALLAAQDPSRNWSAIRNLLLSSGDPLASLARTVTGRRLNARRALTCTDDEITLRMRPDDTSIVTGVGNAMALSVTHVRCADAAGSVSVSVAPGAEVVELADDGTGADHAAGDGTYSALWTPAAAGTYTLSFAGGDEVQVAARTGVVQSPSPATSSDFGHAMAADAQRVLIGAPDEAHAGIDAGAAHLFDAGSGALLRSYHDPGAASGNGFGTAVALHDDLVMIGAPLHDAAEEDEGAAYLFDAATGELLHELANPAPAAADRFGRSVAIMDTTLFVGAPFDDATGTESGRGYLFDRTTGTLLAAIEDPTPFDLEALGYAAAGAGGTVIVSTAYDDDVEYDERQANLKVYDAHAESEGLGSMLFAFDQADEGSGNGFRVAAGRAISVWEDLTVSSYPDISAQDLNSVLSQSIRGAAVFETATGQLIGSLRHAETPGAVAGDEFGTSVAVRDRWAVVGAPGADSAYLFDARTGDLRRSMSLGQTGHNSRFGQSVGVTQDVVFVAASRADSIQQDAGQAYSFPLPPVRGAMKCYRAEGRSPERALHTAADPVGDFSFAPVATRGLCTGARHGRFANADEERRAVCYGARATSQALLPRTIRYRDMLGLRDISLKKLTEICVPAQIDAPPSPFLDRYTCYKSRRAPGTEGFTRRTIDIGDAFEDQSYEILGPEAFCYAATVDGAPPSGPQDHLSCYRVRATAASVFTAPGMSSLDELGTRQLRLKSARSICLPAVVEP
ncbi:MAG TPA: S8 family serine peptidase, partial [Candidatus Binatia bacterium]|nr:S8 family serine peptidase [Candidatus Binatia bacterium]